MHRRAFIAGLGIAAAWPGVARARDMPRVAVLLNFTEKAGQPLLSVLLQELRALGWVDGETAHIDIRWGAGDAERIRKGVVELLALGPDIIVTTGTPPTSRFRDAARSIPIVFEFRHVAKEFLDLLRRREAHHAFDARAITTSGRTARFRRRRASAAHSARNTTGSSRIRWAPGERRRDRRADSNVA
jgi:hypothetical protein